jgi:subtilisin family serine protease
MKKLFIFFCTLLVMNSYSQEIVYKYHLYVKDYKNPPIFKQIGDQLVYDGSNNSLKSFLSDYQITNFYQMFPTSKRPINLGKFQLETTDLSLIKNLINSFPDLFSGFLDVTNEKYDLAYYPNDYGNTNPNGNIGTNIDRSDLDYINIQKAWDITTGNGVTIGMSDSRINATNLDYVNKITFINPSWAQNQTFQNNAEFTHGTHTAGIAAAQGNNNYGSTGVCFDCKIKGTAYGNYNNLLLLAQAGVRVISMSWAGGNYGQQDLIDEIIQDYNTVLIAAAGNTSSFQTLNDGFCGTSSWDATQGRYISSVIGTQYFYPASYNGVISVSGIGQKYLPTENYCCTSPIGPIALFTKDSFSPNVNIGNPSSPIGLIFNGYQQWCGTPGSTNFGIVSSNGIVENLTSNPLVDILAPAFNIFNFADFAENNGNISYFSGGGTSSATPYVSGTVGLMLSVNKCLIPNDIDVILKLTSKDVENMGINQLFHGQIGAGALNAGDAVEFVNEMKKINGNAVIDNHIFNRFDLKLDKINHDLTIQNIDFIDNCIVDFTAKNQIHLLPNTNLKPNTTGRTYLSINPNIDISCNFPNPAKTSNSVQKSILKNTLNSKVVLFPNPNNGSFELINITTDLFGENEISLQVYDLNGRILQNRILFDNEKPNCKIDLKDLSRGIYIVKLTSNDFSQDFKFIKK